VKSMNDRNYLVLLIMVSAALLVSIVNQYRSDAMGARLQVLNEGISAIEAAPVSYETARQVDYTYLNNEIREKVNLWSEIFGPPPKAKPRQAGPNLPQKLKGVVPSLRRQITKKGGLFILIVTPKNARGAYMGIGEKINGVTIDAIGPEVVTFKLNFNKKDYFHDIPRK